jgi:hypothetical protein
MNNTLFENGLNVRVKEAKTEFSESIKRAKEKKPPKTIWAVLAMKK